MPWKTLCGFPPTANPVTLRLPNGAWRPDTVITDYDGNEMFVLLDHTNEMRSYEAVFGDLDGRRLVCVKRHLQRAFWRDGFYFCTYKPNYSGQKPLTERDVDNKKLYPFSYLQISPIKGRFFYRLFDANEELEAPRMRAENPWLGFMSVCCTPSVRMGRWTAEFKRGRSQKSTIYVDQWKNVVDVGPGNDLLAGLCIAYVFDRVQCQPLVTVMGDRDDELEGDDYSIESKDDPNLKINHNDDVEMTNVPPKAGKKGRVDHTGQGNVAYPKQPLANDPRYDRGAARKDRKKPAVNNKDALMKVEDEPAAPVVDTGEPFAAVLGPVEIV